MSLVIEQLVLRLETIELDAYLDDPDGLEAAMVDREQVVGELGRFDLSTLEPEQRAELKQRLAAVLERDQALLPVLVALREENLAARTQAGTSRRALDGYRQLVSSAPPPARRIG
jgi:hypothetical protein